MVFCDVNEIVPKAFWNVMPEMYKGKKYRKLNVGDEVTITEITVSAYQAKDKNSGDLLTRRDGAPILNETCYLLFADGSYSTLKNDKVLGQIAQLTGWFEDGIKVNHYVLDQPEKVKIIEDKQKMGKKEVPVLVFKSI